MRSHRQLLAALITVALATSLVSCKSGSTSSTTSPIDMSPPQAPSNLHRINDPTFVGNLLLWEPSASASVSGYQIYSAPTSSGSFTLLATVGPTTNSYLLHRANVEGTYFYRVRAVGSNNVPSAFTSSVVVVWVSPTTSGPQPGTEGDF